MLNRRSFLLAGVVIVAATTVPVGRADAQLAYLLGATAVTQVFGDGQRLVAVALKYDGPIGIDLLDPALYAVEARTLVRIHLSASTGPSDENGEGPFVILALSPKDEASRLYRLRPGGGTLRLPAALSVTLTPKEAGVPDFGTPPLSAATSSAASGQAPPAFGSEPLSVATNEVRNLVVDDFMQHEFADPTTGETLAYNLLVPPLRDPETRLPVVLFMHDAGVTGPVVDATLVQGLGAVSWASPEDQRRHSCIVVAPQYREQIVNDASQTTSMLETTLHLLDAVAREYDVDPNRIYLTGQSGGGMMAIAMMIREPERFAAAFLVACQWAPELVRPLARQRLWVVVSEGDEKAFPGQNAIMDVIEAEGTATSRTSWDGRSPASLSTAVADQDALGAPVNYSVLRRGTVVPADSEPTPGAEHTNTWRVAYQIPAIRDWILRQTRV